jgi:inorganic triphosphatase YgiF
MDYTIENKIFERMKKAKRGYGFFAGDFAALRKTRSAFRKTEKFRKRIETLFSRLCDQFMMCRNYAKSFGRFKNRILSKKMSLNMIQLINKLNNKNI